MLQDREDIHRHDRARKSGLRAAVLLNERAGTTRHRGGAALHGEIETALAQAGIVAELDLCKGQELRARAEKALASAKAGTIDAVVVGGGDGSVRTVAEVLADMSVPLGILPLGTRNHFARDLRLPLELHAAAETIAAGRQRRVDLAEVNGSVFINNSSVGIYPYMVIDRDMRQAHHRISKWTAMIPAMFRAVKHFPRRRLSLSAEGWTRPYRTPCLFVGNNDYSMDLFTLGRRLHLDQASLSVHVVKQRRPLGFFWMMLRLAFGHATQERDIESFRLTELKVAAKTSRLPVALDGEVEIMRPPLNYRIRPGALLVLAPA